MKIRFDVLGLGCTAVDDLLYVAAYPPADTKQPVLRREKQCGGLTATALVAAARLGAHCAYAGTLGDDEDSRFVVDCLQLEEIDVRHLVHQSAAKPCRSFIVVDETRQTRNIFYDTQDTIGAHPRRPARSVLQSTRVLLVDRFGVPGMIRAARVARAAGIAVVADFENCDWLGFKQLFALPDHLILAEEFACKLTRTRTPAAAVSKLWSPSRQTVVVTCGVRGCWFRDEHQPKAVHQPAFGVKAVDTTGCGDVFHGAYAAALALGLPLVERIRIASAAAALKATRRGGQAGIPKWREVQQFLTKQ